MRAVITVVGKDRVGILAQVATLCAKYQANVMDVTQSILQDTFVMVMMVDISKLSCPLKSLSGELSDMGEESGLVIHVMHEDIFNSMHRI